MENIRNKILNGLNEADGNPLNQIELARFLMKELTQDELDTLYDMGEEKANTFMCEVLEASGHYNSDGETVERKEMMKYFILEDGPGRQYVEYATDDTNALKQAEEKWPSVTFDRISFHGTNPPLWYKQSNKEKKNMKQDGFTLIELMIAIAVIGIIGAIVLYNFNIMAIVYAALVIIGLIVAGAVIVAGFGSVKSVKERRDSTSSFSPRPRNNKKEN